MKWWLLGKPAASLGGTSVSSPIYAPLLAKDLLCGLCHIALSAVTQQCAAKPVPDWSQWSADSRVVWGQVGIVRREHRALSAANPVSLSCLIGSACAYTPVAVPEQCMSHKTLHIFSSGFLLRAVSEEMQGCPKVKPVSLLLWHCWYQQAMGIPNPPTMAWCGGGHAQIIEEGKINFF